MGAEKPSPQPRLIRRYGNRKLYDPEARRYVTLEELGTLIAEGHEICVVDQKTGQDLTNPALAQVLLEEMRRGASRIPRQVLTRLIRLASGPASAWSEWPEPQDTAGRARDEAEKIVSRLLGRGRLSLDEAVALRHDLGQMVHRLVSEAQAGVETRLRSLVVKGEGVAGRSLQVIKGRLEAIESYLEPGTEPQARPRRSPRRTAARKKRSN